MCGKGVSSLEQEPGVSHSLQSKYGPDRGALTCLRIGNSCCEELALSLRAFGGK